MHYVSVSLFIFVYNLKQTDIRGVTDEYFKVAIVYLIYRPLFDLFGVCKLISFNYS